MPTYEYACSACAHQWEQVQRITEAPLEVCPKCAQSAAHRLISGGTNFILKGGGWYSDLYGSPKPSSSSSSSDASGQSDKGSAKSGESAGGGESTSKGSDGGGAKSSGEAAKPASGSSASAPTSS